MFAGGRVSQHSSCKLELRVDGGGVFLTFSSLSTPTNHKPSALLLGLEQKEY